MTTLGSTVTGFVKQVLSTYCMHQASYLRVYVRVYVSIRRQCDPCLEGSDSSVRAISCSVEMMTPQKYGVHASSDEIIPWRS